MRLMPAVVLEGSRAHPVSHGEDGGTLLHIIALYLVFREYSSETSLNSLPRD